MSPEAAGEPAARGHIHPHALVESNEIGAGTRVWAFAHIMEGVSVGESCNIGEGCYLERGAVVGNRVTLKNLVAVWDGVHLEDDVFVGPNVAFTNDPAPRSRAYRARPDQTRVCRGASLGANATILSGIRIGGHALVGAGAVVTRDVPPFGLVYGNPARLRGHVCECARKLVFGGARATCRCGRRYAKRADEVRLEQGPAGDGDAR